MDIILLQKVANLGQIGDRVKVKSGYARNFLVPTGRATMATAANIAKFEAQRHELEAQASAVKFENFKLELRAKAGAEGKLFGSIGTADIAEAAVKAGQPISRSEVRMPTGPIRVTGEHQVQLHLHTDVDVTLAVTIVADEQRRPSRDAEDCPCPPLASALGPWVRAATDCGCRRIPSKPSSRCSAD